MIAVEACGIGSKALLMALAVPTVCSPVIPLSFFRVLLRRDLMKIKT